MKLSVIVPVYNMMSGGKLKNCLDSLLKQDVADMEIIAVDDKSTDDSLAFWESRSEKEKLSSDTGKYCATSFRVTIASMVTIQPFRHSSSSHAVKDGLNTLKYCDGAKYENKGFFQLIKERSPSNDL